MAAPPPGADVQRRHRPTAAGLAVDGREPPGSLSVRWRGKPCFPHVPPSSALRVVSPQFIRYAHDAGFKVQVWTVDDPGDMLRPGLPTARARVQ